MLALEEEIRIPIEPGEGPFGMILCPSRELARQTWEVLDRYCEALSGGQSGQSKGEDSYAGGRRDRREDDAIYGGGGGGGGGDRYGGRDARYDDYGRDLPPERREGGDSRHHHHNAPPPATPSPTTSTS